MLLYAPSVNVKHEIANITQICLFKSILQYFKQYLFLLILRTLLLTKALSFRFSINVLIFNKKLMLTEESNTIVPVLVQYNCIFFKYLITVLIHTRQLASLTCYAAVISSLLVDGSVSFSSFIAF